MGKFGLQRRQDDKLANPSTEHSWIQSHGVGTHGLATTIKLAWVQEGPPPTIAS